MAKRKKSSSNTKQLWGIVILLFLLSGSLIVIGMMLYSALIIDYEDEFCQSFATIYAGTCGGFCAMLIGILTILSTAAAKKRELIKQHIPEFYMPLKYDIAHADFVRFKSKTEKGKIIKFYFQNTDKVAFTIDSVKLYNENKECSEFSDGQKYYVNKGKLFCAKFCFEGCAKEAEFFVRSIDNISYRFKANLDARVIDKVEE